MKRGMANTIVKMVPATFKLEIVYLKDDFGKSIFYCSWKGSGTRFCPVIGDLGSEIASTSAAVAKVSQNCEKDFTLS